MSGGLRASSGPRERARGALVLAALAIVALAAAFFVRARSRPELDLPRFRYALLGGTAEGDRVVIGPDAYVRVELRPERPTEEEIAVGIWFLRGDAAHLVTGPLVRGPDGSVHLEGPRALLFPAGAGEGELVVFVGPDEDVPREAERVAKARASPPDDVQVFATRLSLR